ncbi:MAG: O-antigen ligase family protein [Gemmatimonadaceae bacterium]|nr:O-antigen ligase family protein [Gemmatimonadaceae bacterium]
MAESVISRRVFPLFAWGLAFHSLIIAALYGLFRLPEGLVRQIAAWKEILLAIVLAIVCIRAVIGKSEKTQVTWADFWILALFLTAICYLFTANPLLNAELPVQAQVMGVRDAVYFMLIYFVGRATPDLIESESGARRLFMLILVTCIIGIVERIFVSPEMLVAVGVASYFQDFLGVSAFTTGNEYGLPLNYWTFIAGRPFRRAGSVYLSGQGFAVPFLLFFPIATSYVFWRAKRIPMQVFGYLIICTALLMTLTRMTIMISVIQLVLFVVLMKRPEWAVAGISVMGLLFVAAFIMIPGFPTFIWQTLSWQEGSSVSHMNDWLRGATAFFERPWGWGLGTADQTAVRAGLKYITGDNLFLKYGVEMGVVGLLLLILVLHSIGQTGLTLFRSAQDESRQRMGIVLWLATVGIAINGITAVVFNSITLGWMYFWIAGSGVTAAQSLLRSRNVRESDDA